MSYADRARSGNDLALEDAATFEHTPPAADSTPPPSSAAAPGRPAAPRPVGTPATLFDRWSLVYDLEWMQALTYRPVHDAVLEELERGPHRTILDLGCGTGLFAARLAHEFDDSHVVGCDYSRGMLAQARQRADDVTWVAGNALDLPFPAGRFDTVVSTEAFHWFPDPKAALAQIFRILAPGGRLLLALINPPSPLVSDLARSGSRWLGDPLLWPTRARMRNWLEGAGFEVVSQRRIRRLPFGRVLPPVLSAALRPPAVAGAAAREPSRERPATTVPPG